MADKAEYAEVVRALASALMNLQHAVNAADLRVSLTAGAHIRQANEQANAALSRYSELSQSVLSN